MNKEKLNEHGDELIRNLLKTIELNNRKGELLKEMLVGFAVEKHDIVNPNQLYKASVAINVAIPDMAVYTSTGLKDVEAFIKDVSKHSLDSEKYIKLAKIMSRIKKDRHNKGKTRDVVRQNTRDRIADDYLMACLEYCGVIPGPEKDVGDEAK